VSFGEYLRAEASRQGLDSTRETLQHLGADLAARDLETFIRTVLYSCGWSRGLPAVVDSIRYFSALDILRRMAYPAELLLVFVDLDDETRLERMKARGECADSVELSIIDSRPTEIGWAELRQAADLVVDGRRSPEDNATQIVRWIRALGG
jgi:dephospho-CoA kinase